MFTAGVVVPVLWYLALPAGLLIGYYANQRSDRRGGPWGRIVVNGLRFETGSDIRAADEGAVTAESDLRLGMMVEIRGNVVVDRGVGRASSVRWFSELRGAVGTVDAAARSLVVLGVPVQVPASTVFAGVDSLASLRPGDVVEVYGLRDPTTNRLAATRIELERTADNVAPAEYKLRATVTNLNPTARQFNLGGVVVSYAPEVRIDPAPNGAGLANNQMVTVFSNQPGGATGTWPASRIQVRTLAGRLDGTAYGQVEGLVVGFVSPANFTVAGVIVDASRARFDGGTAAGRPGCWWRTSRMPSPSPSGTPARASRPAGSSRPPGTAGSAWRSPSAAGSPTWVGRWTS